MNSNKGMVVAFCRMNPPTKGHLILVNKMRYIADRKGYDTGLFLSHSNDSKKNPLPYEEKITFVDEAFGDIVDVIMSKANSIYDVLKQVKNIMVSQIWMEKSYMISTSLKSSMPVKEMKILKTLV